MSKGNEKERVLAALQELPDDATFEDAIERLLFMAKVEEGLRASRAGDLIPHEEVKQHFGL